MDYKNAGVDIEAGYKSVELMKKHIQQTMREEVLGGIGGFSGAFSLEKFKNMEKPTLVSGTDGVGTKLKLAFLLDRHDTIGIPEEILIHHKEDSIRIPMVGDIRSLNLGNSVAIVLYEALRQNGFAGMNTEGHLHRLEWDV